jgi:hypothetical protein
MIDLDAMTQCLEEAEISCLQVTGSGTLKICGCDIDSLDTFLRSSGDPRARAISRKCHTITLDASLQRDGQQWTTPTLRFLITTCLLGPKYDYRSELEHYARRVKTALALNQIERYTNVFFEELGQLEDQSVRGAIADAYTRLVLSPGAASDGTSGMEMLDSEVAADDGISLMGKKDRRRIELDRIWGRQRQDNNAADSVDCTVFGPRAGQPGQTVTVQVYLHVPENLDEARSLAKEVDPASARRGSTPLSIDLQRGDFVTLDLDLDGASIPSGWQPKGSPPINRKLLRWSGTSSSANFVVRLDDNADGPVVGRVVVSREDAPLGSVTFTIGIGHQSESMAAPDHIGKGKRFRLVFVSYAREDQSEVLRRVQMLEALGIEFFQDLLSLAPGTKWAKSIEAAIDSCDGFFLFWSSAARESEWVNRELEYAIHRKGGVEDNPPEIIPIAIEGPPVPDPPQALKEIHFGSHVTYFMQEWRAKPDMNGMVACPKCGLRFKTSSASWDGKRHLRCGTAIVLQ